MVPRAFANTMTFFAVLLVAIAASCINVGKALQKEGTKRLPRFSMDRGVVATYSLTQRGRVGWAWMCAAVC